MNISPLFQLHTLYWWHILFKIIIRIFSASHAFICRLHSRVRGCLHLNKKKTNQNIASPHNHFTHIHRGTWSTGAHFWVLKVFNEIPHVNSTSSIKCHIHCCYILYTDNVCSFCSCVRVLYGYIFLYELWRSFWKFTARTVFRLRYGYTLPHSCANTKQRGTRKYTLLYSDALLKFCDGTGKLQHSFII